MTHDRQAPLRVVVAGATGWAGSALSAGIAGATDLELVGAVSRTHAGQSLGAVLDNEALDAPVHATAAEALATTPDVFVEYTRPEVARDNVLAALGAGAHVVIGTSGLTDDDFAAFDEVACARALGVLACGNFALGAVLMMKFSELAAHWMKSWEVIDYAHAGKADAPSGTARELAHRLANVGAPAVAVPTDQITGERAARGAELGGTHVHSVRLPGFVISIESIFGGEGETLTLRHDAGTSAEPYVAGALLAIRGVAGLTGVHRGLDTVLDGLH